jgi:hypothetical protein
VYHCTSVVLSTDYPCLPMIYSTGKCVGSETGTPRTRKISRPELQGAPSTQMRTIAHWRNRCHEQNKSVNNIECGRQFRVSRSRNVRIPHTILKTQHCTENLMDYNYIYFHLQKLQLGSIDAAYQDLQYPLKNSARAIFFSFLIFLFCYFLLFFSRSYSQSFKIVCTSSKFNTFYFSWVEKLGLKYP